jgi:hypothetical protein
MNDMNIDAAGAVTGWTDFDAQLRAYLTTMTDIDDHLIVELPETGDDGTTPYAQFAVVEPGLLRAEVSGNPVLAPAYRLANSQLAALNEGCGWELPGPESDCPNLVVMLGGADAPEILAALVREVLQDYFGIPHPTLMSVRAWGPAALGVSVLGLPSTEDVASELPAVAQMLVPNGPDDLRAPVAAGLHEFLGEAPSVDGDGDFHLTCDSTDVWVRVRQDQPAVEVFARVVHDVRSRRQAAIEANLLNRDQAWTKYVVADRAVFQVLRIPAHPFAPEHLAGMLPVFFESLREVRADLALRTGGRAA